MKLLQSARADAPGGHGGTQCAVGFPVVTTIAEAAFVEMGKEFAEAPVSYTHLTLPTN